MKKITHLTSAHPRYDTRIFVKECSSLAKDYQVSLIVSDGKGDEQKGGIAIHDVGRLQGRLNRMLKTTERVYQRALALDSDLYHFHDPELLYVGWKLKRKGKKVIYDAHEDIALQILAKHYLSYPLHHLLSFGVKHFQNFCIRRFDAVVAATPFIKEKFVNINERSVDVSNFPIITELSNIVKWEEREDKVCYIGALAKVRGISEIVKALELTPKVRLNLAGTFFDTSLEEEVRQAKGWEQVDYHGFVGRTAIKALLSTSKIGLVTLHKIINYEDALPVKMFEYMLAGIPVVASDIKLWKSIVNEAKCGICVDPYDPIAIAEAVNYLMAHPDRAHAMGENGKKAVIEKFNWHNEEHKLLQLYGELFAS